MADEALAVRNMQIKIPRWLVRAGDRFGDWANVPIWARDRFEIRRIDVILAIGFVGCVSWYGFTSGWRMAVISGVMYLAMMAVALWLL